MDCSIIIPVYNRKVFLLRTLDSISLAGYDRNNYEVIVIDDGSDDLCKEDFYIYRFNLKVIHYDRTKKSGAPFARNRGIENSAGKYLIFLDCDQLVEKDFIDNHMLRFQKETGFILQIGTRKMLNENGSFTPDFRKRLYHLFSGDLTSWSGPWSLVFSHNISINREAVEKYGGFDENFKGWGLEDLEFGYRMHQNGVRILYNPDVEVSHLYHKTVYDKNRFMDWRKNLDYFMIKYKNDMPVRLLEILYFYLMDLKKVNLFALSNQDDLMVQCYKRFETALRCFLREDVKAEEFVNWENLWIAAS